MSYTSERKIKCRRCTDNGWVEVDEVWVGQFPEAERAARRNSVIPCESCSRGQVHSVAFERAK